jgi:hypothetical protein
MPGAPEPRGRYDSLPILRRTPEPQEGNAREGTTTPLEGNVAHTRAAVGSTQALKGEKPVCADRRA